MKVVSKKHAKMKESVANKSIAINPINNNEDDEENLYSDQNEHKIEFKSNEKIEEEAKENSSSKDNKI